LRTISINITSTAKTLTAFSGLHLFDNLFHKFGIRSLIGNLMPTKKKNRGLGSSEKWFAGVMAFVAGAECIDDLDAFAPDPLFDSLTRSPAPVTMGNFMRSFSLRQIEQIRNTLPVLAWNMRRYLDPNPRKIVFRMDGTTHQQYGLKMEGVEWSYKDINCLTSQNLFDDRGLCYGFHLRGGATHSSVGAVEMMELAFKTVGKAVRKLFVADSAYASLAIYNCLLVNLVRFGICLPENAWAPILKKFSSKITWRSTRLRFFDSPKCEVGSCLYPIKGLAMGRSYLRVVFIRAKKKKPEPGDNHPYHYYAVVTDMDESQMSNEHVLKLYRGRAQVENNIKDLKYGMDFHHFPCQKLSANHIWGLMGIMAYNLMRVASFTISKNGCFIKTVRRKMVTIAGEVIRHARSIEIRLMNHVAKEVNRISMMLSRAFLEVIADCPRPAPS
jgi:hypothetical protein